MVSVHVPNFAVRGLPLVAAAIIAATLVSRAGAAERAAGTSAVAYPARPVDCEYEDPRRPRTEKEKESACLARLKGLATRTPHKLSLRLDDGKVVTLEDKDQSCDSPNLNAEWDLCVAYELIGFRPAEHMYIVRKSYYEDSDVVLVSSRSGRQEALATVPRFSPSGKRFVSVDNNGSDGGYDLAIWSTGNAEPARLEWQYKASEGESYSFFTFVEWLSDDRIKLRASGAKGPHVEVVRAGKGWRIVDPAATP